MVSMLENVVESIFNATHKMCAELMVCQNYEERIGARSICVKCMESFYFHWFGKPTAFFVLTPINKQKSLQYRGTNNMTMHWLFCDTVLRPKNEMNAIFSCFLFPFWISKDSCIKKMGQFHFSNGFSVFGVKWQTYKNMSKLILTSIFVFFKFSIKKERNAMNRH